MLILCVRIQRPFFASSLRCFRIRCNINTSSSYPQQVLQPADNECNDFLPWLRRKSGAEISSQLTLGKSSYGWSLFACEPIQAGDCILKVPYSAQLASDNLHPKVSCLLGEDVGNVARLALVILLHQKLGQASEWAPYISCLPPVEEMHSTIFWSDEELEMIKISSLYDETLKHKAQIEKDFSSIKDVIDHFPEYFEDVTLYKFKHAYNLVESRAWISTRGVSMIPFADFFNHDAFSETDVLSDDFTQVSEVIADENYAPGDEVLIRYGKFSNNRLLLDFGFIFPSNKYDKVHVEVDVPQHDHLRAMKLDLLDRHTTPALKDVNELHSSGNCFMVMYISIFKFSYSTIESSDSFWYLCSLDDHFEGDVTGFAYYYKYYTGKSSLPVAKGGESRKHSVRLLVLYVAPLVKSCRTWLWKQHKMMAGWLEFL